jgi:very-short-patch-repair endonuclease
VHRARVADDAARDRQLRALGLHVLRLANEQVLSDMEATVSLISLALLPLSARRRGGGG